MLPIWLSLILALAIYLGLQAIVVRYLRQGRLEAKPVYYLLAAVQGGLLSIAFIIAFPFDLIPSLSLISFILIGFVFISISIVSMITLFYFVARVRRIDIAKLVQDRWFKE
ncbi:MAG: hypothetical protein ACW97O_11625 [Candidatus Thorarchaeota archaeon]